MEQVVTRKGEILQDPPLLKLLLTVRARGGSGYCLASGWACSGCRPSQKIADPKWGWCFEDEEFFESLGAPANTCGRHFA